MGEFQGILHQAFKADGSFLSIWSGFTRAADVGKNLCYKTHYKRVWPPISSSDSLVECKPLLGRIVVL